MIDRNPLVTIASIALEANKRSAADIAALESIFTYCWDQLAQRRSDAEMAKLLNDLDILDLLPNTKENL